MSLRHVDRENRFDPRGGGCGDGASVGFDGPLHDGEAKSGSLYLGLGMVLLNTVEAFEDKWKISCWDSNPVVSDSNHKVVIMIHLRSDPDFERDAWILF